MEKNISSDMLKELVVKRKWNEMISGKIQLILKHKNVYALKNNATV